MSYGVIMTACCLFFAAKNSLFSGAFAVLSTVVIILAVMLVLAVNYTPLKFTADRIYKTADRLLCKQHDTAQSVIARLATAIGPAVIILAVNMLTAAMVGTVGTAESVSCFAQLAAAVIISAVGADIFIKAKN